MVDTGPALDRFSCTTISLVHQGLCPRHIQRMIVMSHTSTALTDVPAIISIVTFMLRFAFSGRVQVPSNHLITVGLPPYLCWSSHGDTSLFSRLRGLLGAAPLRRTSSTWRISEFHFDIILVTYRCGTTVRFIDFFSPVFNREQSPDKVIIVLYHRPEYIQEYRASP